MSAPVQVRPCAGARDIEAFIHFPYTLYGDQPHWVPPLLMERRDFLNPAKNPMFDYAKVQLYLAVRGDQVLGTIAAVRNDRFSEFHPEEAAVGFFGLYEAVPEPEVAQALFCAAETWLAEEGCTVARGPVNLTTNDVVGLLVDGFDQDNCLMMPYNPAYYADQFAANGFTKCKDLYAYYLGRDDDHRRLTSVAAHLQHKGGIQVRNLDMRHWRRELDFVRSTYNSAWSRNWGFVPWTDRELEYIAKELKPLVDPRFAFVGSVDGVPAGFIVSVPDANEALKLARGRLLPTGLLKILWKLKVRGCANLRTMIMGVLPEYRRRGLDLLMIHETIRNGQHTGYQGAELSWILEDNQALLGPLVQLGARRTKTYRIYDRPL